MHDFNGSVGPADCDTSPSYLSVPPTSSIQKHVHYANVTSLAPEAMATSLSALTNLECLCLCFDYPPPRPSLTRHPPPLSPLTRSILPSLASYIGTCSTQQLFLVPASSVGSRVCRFSDSDSNEHVNRWARRPSFEYCT
jgi:hypothetical protein